MAAFEQAVWRDLVSRGVDYVRGNHQAQIASMPAEGMRRQVEASLVRARQYGFEGDADLFRYLDLVYGLGSEFDRDGQRPWVREVLLAGAYSPHTKIDLLTQLAAPELGRRMEDKAVVYDEEEREAVDDTPETPDEEISPIVDDAEDFVPESEVPEELPEDVIVMDEEETAVEAEA